MKNKPQIIAYILLNIIISAATIFFVMWLWERSHPKTAEIDNDLSAISLEIESSAISQTSAENNSPAEPTTVFINGEYDVRIETIVGPGDLDVEYVEISNHSQGAVDMTGWQLIDNKGQAFTFPTIILNTDGDIKILSQTGINTVIELYWQSDTPIWESGETAHLLDGNGNTIASYSIP